MTRGRAAKILTIVRDERLLDAPAWQAEDRLMALGRNPDDSIEVLKGVIEELEVEIKVLREEAAGE